MKRFFIIILAAAMLLLCACAKTQPQEPELTAEPEVTQTPDMPEATSEPNGTDEPAPTPEPTASAKGGATLTDSDSTGFDLPEDRICIVDPEGMKITVTMNGNAENVRLTAVEYDEELNFIGEGETLWSGGSMKAGDSFGLRVWIPDVLPNVALCYSDCFGEHILGIFQSGEDGHLMFIEL